MAGAGRRRAPAASATAAQRPQPPQQHAAQPVRTAGAIRRRSCARAGIRRRCSLAAAGRRPPLRRVQRPACRASAPLPAGPTRPALAAAAAGRRRRLALRQAPPHRQEVRRLRPPPRSRVCKPLLANDGSKLPARARAGRGGARCAGRQQKNGEGVLSRGVPRERPRPPRIREDHARSSSGCRHLDTLVPLTGWPPPAVAGTLGDDLVPHRLLEQGQASVARTSRSVPVPGGRGPAARGHGVPTPSFEEGGLCRR